MTGPQVGSPVSEEPSLDRVRVLVVDDDRQWARVTGQLLESNDEAFAVEAASSLEAGREEFHTSEVDCVVCDYQLGDGTGLDLLETVRAADELFPFLLVTGRGDEAVASDAIGAGVTDYIRKGTDDRADLLAGRVANAVRSYRTERALEREHRSKNAMLDVLTATTSESELYRQFCSQLVDAREYACAWIGTEEGSGQPVPQAAAGREEYVEAVVAGEQTQVSEEPAWQALAGDESVVVRGIGDSGSADDWTGTAREYGFESAVAVPVRHDGVRFGVLAAYAGESGVLDERELAALLEYGETIGYALRTAERKRSLMSSSPVTVEVEIEDDSVPMVALSNALPADAAATTLSAVTREDGTTLYVVEVTGASEAAFAEAADAVEPVESFDSTEVDGSDRGDSEPGSPTLRCEVVAASPTPEEVLADNRARVDRTVVSDGVTTLSVSVPDDGRLGTLSETLGAVYDGASVSTIWTGREETGVEEADPLAELTGRQREVLRHAFEVGYFDRPRGASATELAEHFDVARTTLSQHLRTAQRKVFGTLLT